MLKRYRKYAPDARDIPPGAIKVAPKVGAVCAYVWDANGKFYVKIYYGAQRLPNDYYGYRDAAAREKFVRGRFEAARLAAEAKAKRAAEKAAWVNPYKVGDIFKGSWGYDQTNIDYFEVVGVSGKMLSIRELQQGRSGEGWGGSSKCVPLPGAFKGDVKRVRAGEYIKSPIHGYLHFEAPKVIGGVPVYDAAYWSSGH